MSMRPFRMIPLALATGAIPMLSALAQQQATPPTTTPPPANERSAETNVRRVERAEAAEPKSEVAEKIKKEAMDNSRVMETLGYLTDVIGPRLTASPSMKRANEWTRDRMASWGMENAHLEAWGPFGKGWTLRKFSMQVSSPQCIPLIAFPKAWSPSLDGVVTGELVDLGSIKTEDELNKLKGKVKGSFALMSQGALNVNAHFTPEGSRLTDEELLELANADGVTPRRPRNRPQAANEPRRPSQEEMAALAQLNRKKLAFAMEEGVVGLIEGSSRGDGGTLFSEQATVPSNQPANQRPEPGARRASAWDKDAPKFLPQFVVSKEHYNRLVRMIGQGETLKITAELAADYHDDAETFNTIAEIPGTDPKLKDEVVMLGGHMDSWHTGTGATDNAAGVSVAMEAARILKALDLKPRRTIRVALWSGEEQGLFGSRAYVKEHFGETEGRGGPGGGGGGMGGGNNGPRKVVFKPEYEKFSAYFNLDNGTGKVRGVYLQGNEAARGVFRPWLAPFREMGASTLTISNTGGTDHQSFDGIGLPGFQFIQDVIEYDSRTHHSNQDVFDRIQADDMKQASAVMASFVLNTANRDEKFPRKPSPELVPAPASSPAPATQPAATTSARN